MPPVDLSALAHAVLNHTPPGCHSGRCEAGSRNARRLAELVLAGAGDDGLPVTAEWLLKAGFVLRAGRQSYGVGRYDAGNWLLTLKQAGSGAWLAFVFDHGVATETANWTRGHVRRLCVSLGVTLPEVTGHE